MKILLIGGTGKISLEVVNRAIELNMDVTVLNRGNHVSKLPKSVHLLIADYYNDEEVLNVLKDKYFDVVIQFIAYNVKDVKRDIKLLSNHCKQYIFISSASAYKKPLPHHPITEDIPLDNPYWAYSKNKAKAEKYLHTVTNLAVTIVRPSHTYDSHTLLVVMKKDGYPYAHLKRLIEHKPIIIPDDGKNLWTVTHAIDFAQSFVDLIGNEKAYHQTYHITSEKHYTWEQLTQLMADVLHVKPNIIHIPTDFIIKYMPYMEGPLLGDKAWQAIFDNQKIKDLSKNYRSQIGYEDCVKDVVDYYLKDESLHKIDLEFEKTYDMIIEKYLSL